MSDEATLSAIADLLISARKLTLRLNNRFVLYLIDMTMMQVGFELAAAIKASQRKTPARPVRRGQH